MPLSDTEIFERCQSESPMIAPFQPHLVRQAVLPSVREGAWRRQVISYGTASYAYDMRMAMNAQMPVSGMLDPKRPELAIWESPTTFADNLGYGFEIPAHGFILTESVEWWHIPD